jgi:glycine hydroxymethyltransferase
VILCREEFAKAIDSSIFPGNQGGPLMHVIAAKAVAFSEALEPAFKVYQQAVLDNARALADGLLGRGFTLVSGGTDNHLLLIDFRKSEITGKVAQHALDRANITTNRNSVPDDPRSPFVTSGLRLGTPAVTTRGMGTGEMAAVAAFIERVLAAVDDDSVADAVGAEVASLCASFPLYPSSAPARQASA